MIRTGGTPGMRAAASTTPRPCNGASLPTNSATGGPGGSAAGGKTSGSAPTGTTTSCPGRAPSSRAIQAALQAVSAISRSEARTSDRSRAVSARAAAPPARPRSPASVSPKAIIMSDTSGTPRRRATRRAGRASGWAG